MEDFIMSLSTIGYQCTHTSDDVYLNENYAKYSDLLKAFSAIIINTQTERVDLSDNEMKNLEDISSINIFDEFQCNDHLLELKQALLHTEIEILEDEVTDLTREVKDIESMIQKENEEEKTICQILKSLEEKSNLHIKYFTNEYTIFERDYVNSIIAKATTLNKSAESILCELDLNMKCLNNPNKILVGYKKCNNQQVEDVLSSLENCIEVFLQGYTQIKEQKKDKLNSEFNLTFFDELVKECENVKGIEKELVTNDIIKKLHYSKQKFKNDAINNFIIYKQKGLVNNYLNQIRCPEETSLGVKSLLNTKITKAHLSIETAYTQLKAKFITHLSTTIIQKQRRSEIKFISQFTLLQQIIFAVFPFLEIDLNITQEIFDTIVNLIEIYNEIHNELVSNQVKYNYIYSLKRHIFGISLRKLKLRTINCLLTKETQSTFSSVKI